MHVIRFSLIVFLTCKNRILEKMHVNIYQPFRSIKKTPEVVDRGPIFASNLTNYKLKILERNSTKYFTQATGGFNRPCCLSRMFVLHWSVLLCFFYGFILEKKNVFTMAHLLTI